jgi:hypothetical protein
VLSRGSALAVELAKAGHLHAQMAAQVHVQVILEVTATTTNVKLPIQETALTQRSNQLAVNNNIGAKML